MRKIGSSTIAAVVRRKKTGYSIPAIAKEFKLTEKEVETILNPPPEPKETDRTAKEAGLNMIRKAKKIRCPEKRSKMLQLIDDNFYDVL